jgi:hypothetical protein
LRNFRPRPSDTEKSDRASGQSLFLTKLPCRPHKFKLERQFQIELKAFEEARLMKYVTTIERMAEERAKLEEKREISLNMLRMNMSPETIAQATGLTIAQIRDIQNLQN